MGGYGGRARKARGAGEDGGSAREDARGGAVSAGVETGGDS